LQRKPGQCRRALRADNERARASVGSHPEVVEVDLPVRDLAVANANRGCRIAKIVSTTTPEVPGRLIESVRGVVTSRYAVAVAEFSPRIQ
jgi:hypothetical protein